MVAHCGKIVDVTRHRCCCSLQPGWPVEHESRCCRKVGSRRYVRRSRRIKAEKAARGAQPEEEERTDGELNWRLRKHRVGGKKATGRVIGGWPHVAQATWWRIVYLTLISLGRRKRWGRRPAPRGASGGGPSVAPC